MKLLLFPFVVVWQISNAQINKDSLDITTLLKNDYIAFGNYDANKHIDYCTDDYILIENGEIWDLKKEIEYINKNQNRKTKRVDSFQFYDLNIFDHTAYAVYQLQSDITENDTTKNYHWSESAVFRKIEGKWKIALIHSTRLVD